MHWRFVRDFVTTDSNNIKCLLNVLVQLYTYVTHARIYARTESYTQSVTFFMKQTFALQFLEQFFGYVIRKALRLHITHIM
jgi:hypothetical protein